MMLKNKKVLIPSIIILLLLLGGGAYLFSKSNKTVSNKITSSTSTKKQAKQRAANNKTTSSKSKNTTKVSPNSNTSSTNTQKPTPVAPSESQTSNNSQALIAPFGSFVSNNNPNMSLSSQNYELSTCETTPGASCSITFTNNSGQSISLPQETTDNQGVASWSWYLSQKGFSAGSWKIIATANLNGETKTTTDPSPLNVES